MNTQVCPNCQNRNPVNGTTNRLVTESCGHMKCIECLLKETTGCQACKLEKTKENHEHKIETDKDLNIPQTEVDSDQTTDCNEDDIEETERNEAATKIGPKTNGTATNIGPKTNGMATNIGPKTNGTATNICPKTNGIATNIGPNTNETATNFDPETEVNTKVSKINTDIANEEPTCPASLELKVRKIKDKVDRDWSSKKMFKPETPHIRVDKDESGTTYYCLKCQRQFRARSHVSYHAYCDGTKKPYQCNLCDKEFSSTSHYQYHLRTHAARRPFACDVCGAAFQHRGKLMRHVTTHDVDKKYACKQCSKAFSNPTALRRHGLLHSGEQPHQCHLCDRKFRDSSNYKKHLQRHGDDHKCLCGSCGVVTGRMRAHRCPRCAHAFHSRKDMRRHMHVHNDARPFRCKVCDRRFRRKDNLERHIRNKHPLHSTASAADCDWDALRQRANVTTTSIEINDSKSSEKTQLEKLNPLPPIPKDVIQSMCDKGDQTNTKIKSEIDKSYILEANIARQSVIVVKQTKQENRNFRHSSPETAYVHKIKKSMTNSKDSMLPPIDTNRLVQFYKQVTTDDLDIGAPRPENVQKLKTILMVDEKNMNLVKNKHADVKNVNLEKNKNGDVQMLKNILMVDDTNMNLEKNKNGDVQMLKTILMADEKNTKNMNGDRKEEGKQTPMHWRKRKMTPNMNW